MKIIKYEIDVNTVEIEVTDEFAETYAEMEREDARIERKETRRHQSLDKSLDNGFDIPDVNKTPDEAAISGELTKEIKDALNLLSERQRVVFLSSVIGGLSFTDIGKRLGISKQVVFIYFERAQKKLKEILG